MSTNLRISTNPKPHTDENISKKSENKQQNLMDTEEQNDTDSEKEELKQSELSVCCVFEISNCRMFVPIVLKK